MSEKAKSLFELAVDPEEVSPEFDALRTLDEAHPGRQMLEAVYQEFTDPDGNFIEQFQTTGFNARYFELYLFAYFFYSGYSIDRSHSNPDFLITRNTVTVAVEATTVNPSTSGVLAEHGRRISELSPGELRDYESHELPIRFGSPLISKLRKKYWNLDHCRDIPLVIAIEAFHDNGAYLFSDSALIGYLYGIRQSASWSQAGTLEIETTTVEQHSVGGKVIPSGFFQQSDAPHVSAVIFTNSGTSAKFSRMGYQSGFGCDLVNMERRGFCFNPAPRLCLIIQTLFSLQATRTVLSKLCLAE